MAEYEVEILGNFGVQSEIDFTGGYVPSIRQRIISAIENGLKSVLKAGGYQTNIGARVLLCRPNVDKSALPATVIWPRPETAVKMSGKVKATMPVRFESIVSIQPLDDMVKLGEQMLADLRARIESQTEEITGGLADHIEYTNGGVDSYPDPGDTVINCGVVYNITYKTKIGNPFQQ